MSLRSLKFETALRDRRVWQRGLAIGVRGPTLEVDTKTGVVLRSGPLFQGRVSSR